MATATKTTTVTTEPTAGSLYTAPTPEKNTPHRTYQAVDGNTYDEATGDLVAHGSIAPVDESGIRNEVLRQMQAEINATNEIYAEKLNEVKTQGLSRLGSTRAAQARGGLLGSDFSGAQNDKVTSLNNEQEGLVDAEKRAKIGEIMGKVSSEATAQIAAKRAAQAAGIDEYVKYLGQKKTDRATNLSKLSASLLDSKLTPDNLKPGQLQEIASSYGVSTADILAAFSAEKKTRDEAQNKLTVEADKLKFDQDLETKKYALDEMYKKGQLSLDQYKAQTDRLKAQSDQFKAGLDSNGNPISSASSLKSQALTTAQDILTGFKSGKGTSAVGGNILNRLGGVGDWLDKGTDRADFRVKFDNLKSLLSLDNVKLLKGQGAVSDAERRLLEQASAKLDRGQSEEAFQSALEDIITALGGGGGADTVTIQKPDGTTGTIPRANLEAALKLGAKQI